MGGRGICSVEKGRSIGNGARDTAGAEGNDTAETDGEENIGGTNGGSEGVGGISDTEGGVVG